MRTSSTRLLIARMIKAIHFLKIASERLRKLGTILNKDPDDRTEEEKSFLQENSCFIPVVESRIVKQCEIRRRAEEIEDELSVVRNKIDRLVRLINESSHTIVYTGAGISTASSIPDYRGPNGVWTQLNKNKSPLKTQDLALSVPSYTHMALARLVKCGIVKHVLSQNCDGLHLRSGLPIERLSEIHGSMFVEVCPMCKKMHYRDFDVTERTSVRHHRTGRFCVDCKQLDRVDDKSADCELIDTIVHFGEKGHLDYPLNWSGAMENVHKTDLIICLGSSLKVLKNYSCLWPKKTAKRKLNLAIVNLQWTPKDHAASLKINSKCDLVMKKLMDKLNLKVEAYAKERDRLQQLYIPLKDDERLTCNRFQLFSTNIKNEIESPTEIVPGWYGKGLKRLKT